MTDTCAPAEAPALEPEPVQTVEFGLWWPAGDPGQLRAAADAWEAMADALEQASSGLDAAVSAVTEGNSGEAIDAFAARWARCGRRGGALPTAADYCRDMAASLREFADAIDEVREEILRLAAEIAASVALGVGLAVFTAGLSAGVVGATTTRIIQAAVALGARLAGQAGAIVARVAAISAIGAVESMAVNTVVQLGSNAVFNENHNPLDGFSLGEVGTSGALGFTTALPIAGLSTARALRAGRGAELGLKPPIASPPRSPGWSVPSSVRNKFPSSWGAGRANRRGTGTRWLDPENPSGNGVRIDKGNPSSTQPSQRVDHVVVRKDGVVLGRDGKPIKGSIREDAENAHIPLSEYEKWSSWDKP